MSGGIVVSGMSGVRLNGPYLGDAEYDASGTIGGALSTRRHGRSLSGRVAYQKSPLDLSGSDLAVLSVMADGALEIRASNSLLKPYISTGISYAMLDVERFGNAGADAVMALQLGAGVGLLLSESIMIDARYRYFSPMDEGRMNVRGVPVQMDLGAHNLLVGMRLNF